MSSARVELAVCTARGVKLLEFNCRPCIEGPKDGQREVSAPKSGSALVARRIGLQPQAMKKTHATDTVSVCIAVATEMGT